MSSKSWVRFAAPVVAAVSVAVLAQPAGALGIRIPWRPTVLPLPAGGGNGFLTGSNGKGEYTGTFAVNGVQQVVSWRGGQPVVRGLPAGYERADAVDENAAGTVVGTAYDYETKTNHVFVLDSTGFHVKENPPTWENLYAVAVNTRGDVLARANRTGPYAATVVWPADGTAPTIIPSGNDTYYARDLDDDGTVLFDSGPTSALWKNGVIRQLSPSPAAWAEALAIRNGVVVGKRGWGGGEQAARWSTPDATVGLEGGASAISVNQAGLTAGLLPNPSSTIWPGNATAWRGTVPGEVQRPGTYTQFQARLAADDGSLAGFATNGSLDEGGVPVVWHLTP
ncbi:hypothetical protein [Amycolatopsis sp. SID8362]|uniref:hypothetical protein n=1 Tax=Amycolatopsis sp. SID8362 TaxID=2690346 RepID=UPI00136A1546|nr:hypothetical protein [Amycolatopsis sp. SID8362]NBH12199.1 hypothetical protein [Amycolatopsis sp. SID8362]NED48891.1 hypothetical protein [Amycolatopsis sp. SID8362]